MGGLASVIQKVPQHFHPLSDYIGNNTFTNSLPPLFKTDEEKETQDDSSSENSSSVRREMQLLKSRVEKLEKVVVTNQMGTI